MPLKQCRGKSQCGGFEAILQNSFAQVCMHVTNQPVGVEVGSGEHVPRAVDPSDICLGGGDCTVHAQFMSTSNAYQ